jgi:uncharacterized protein (DUF983 family)
MKRWPWISIVLAAIVILNPVGLDIIEAAFFSNEQLSNNIWQPIAIVAILLLLSSIALEWSIRKRRVV